MPKLKTLSGGDVIRIFSPLGLKSKRSGAVTPSSVA